MEGPSLSTFRPLAAWVEPVIGTPETWLAHLASPLLAQAADPDAGVAASQWIALLIAAAVLIVPFFVGPWLARQIKMPAYGTRLALILLAIVVATSVLISRRPGLGVGLRGGTIVGYEIDPGKMAGSDRAADISSQDLIKPLTERINPSGTQEIVIRPYGEDQIEIIVPEVDETEVDRIKKLVEEAGILRFAIVANRADHTPEINKAREQADSEDLGLRLSDVVRDAAGQTVAIWAEVDRESAEVDSDRPLRVEIFDAILRDPQSGQFIDLPPSVFSDDPLRSIAKYIDSQGIPSLEILMIVDPNLDVTGEDLDFATSTLDESGSPAVAFNLTDIGGNKFYALTQNNSPTGNRQRRLGIILDDRLLSAPNIITAIRTEGRITGRFTSEEVEGLVQVLRAGQLPAALTKKPIAENQIDATLGADTIEKGFLAIGVSLILVLLFILYYYRFAGVIACLALVLNLALILATMVLINQPLTLPGLAGLVLTVGMSVDANVLIFERIREEIKKGAAPRMAVRNGFGKATVTIVDANLTTLITAIVLYAIGTDQIRGFAVTLILGILFSMFTAIYVSRTLFDIAERKGWLSLGMSDSINRLREKISGSTGVDFVSKGKISLVVSALLVAVGIASIVARGGTIFDIDFNGGSSVQFRLTEAASTDEVRRIVAPVMNDGTDDIPYTVNGVSMSGAADGTVYKVDSSFENVEDLQSAVTEAFAASETYDLVTGKVRVVNDNAQSRRFGSSAIRLVAAQDDINADTVADDTNAAVDVEDAIADAIVDEKDPQIGGDAAEMSDEDEASSAVLDAAADLGNDSMTSRVLQFGSEEDAAVINAATLKAEIVAAASATGLDLSERVVRVDPIGDGADQWTEDSSLKFAQWKVSLPLDDARMDQVVGELSETLNTKPVWISSSSIGKRVAGDMIGRAFGALFASLLCIIGYIWFRFQRVIYGLAAVVALIHDVLITIGAIAISYWLAGALGFLMIDPFKISLTVVAAILTIIGYSLNDTIVVFDRIRETKGKAPRLSGEMINHSINQTLSRTLLTSITTLIVVVLLYFFGGAGIHAFAFALVIGVLVGTYSSIFVASPVLYWLVSRDEVKTKAA